MPSAFHCTVVRAVEVASHQSLGLDFLRLMTRHRPCLAEHWDETMPRCLSNDRAWSERLRMSLFFSAVNT